MKKKNLSQKPEEICIANKENRTLNDTRTTQEIKYIYSDKTNVSLICLPIFITKIVSKSCV